ncbi:MAG: DUF3570 domain-containing protein [Elusimicrobia bacterium]|nr:DUF3570 domain-containing protein [Elusimicrobiota bacterium]
MAAIRKLALAAVLALCLEKAASASTDMEFVVNSMYQSGKGGKQVYDGSGDQSLTLYEPVLYINSQIDHDTSVFGSAVFDVLSSASAKAFDSGTGASRGGTGGGEDGEGGGEGLLQGWQTRVGAEAGYSKRKGSWVFTPTAGGSHELSYNSLHGGLNVQKFLAEENFVLSAGLFHYSDEANPWDIQKGKFAGFQSKTTNSANASATQILDERSIALAGISFTRQNGFLEGTRNTVSTGTVTQRASEQLPDAREKWTANVRYVRSLSGKLAFHLDYRYYTDTWNIRAHTWEPSLAWSFSDEAGTIKLGYRRYSQTAARYYAGSFPVMKTYMTSDSDLAKFSADEVSAQLAYAPEGEPGRTAWEYGGTLLYYKRSDGLSVAVAQASLTAKF